MVDEGRVVIPSDETTPGEESKAQWQQEMASARDSISQTINEIGDTVTTQTQAVRTAIENSLDLREHIRRHPKIAGFSAAALGFAAGYALYGAVSNIQSDSNGSAPSRLSTAHSVTARPSAQRGWWDRFRTTRAYRRFTTEAGAFSEQLVNELFKVSKAALIPMAARMLDQALPSEPASAQPSPPAKPAPIQAS